MPISPEPQSDPATADDANKGPSPGWLLASLVLYIGVERLVSLFGVPAMGEAAAYSALGFAIMLTVFWKKHGEKWFWLFVIIDVILHIGAIIFVPWSGTHHESRDDVIFFWLDLLGSYGLLRMIQWTSIKRNFRVFSD